MRGAFEILAKSIDIRVDFGMLAESSRIRAEKFAGSFAFVENEGKLMFNTLKIYDELSRTMDNR